MKHLFFSDLHAHNHEQHAHTTAEGRNSRFQDILNVLEEIRLYCHQNDIGIVTFCGDVFHTRTKIDTEVYSETWKAFKRISEHCSQLRIVVGNHDQHNKSGTIHSLDAFTAFAEVIDTPTALLHGTLGWCYMAPFTTDMEAWHKCVASIPADIAVFVFHQGLKEASVGAYDVYVKAEVSVADLPFSKVKYCIGGHYHKHQRIGANVLYCGSPLQLDFGERTEDKGFLVLDDETWNIEFVRTTAPRFVWGDRAACAAARPGDFLRLTCLPNEVEAMKREFPTAQLDIQVEKKDANVRVTAAAVSDDRVLVQAYVDQQPTKLDKAKLLSYGSQLLSTSEEV